MFVGQLVVLVDVMLEDPSLAHFLALCLKVKQLMNERGKHKSKFTSNGQTRHFSTVPPFKEHQGTNEDE